MPVSKKGICEIGDNHTSHSEQLGPEKSVNRGIRGIRDPILTLNQSLQPNRFKYNST